MWKKDHKKPYSSFSLALKFCKNVIAPTNNVLLHHNLRIIKISSRERGDYYTDWLMCMSGTKNKMRIILHSWLIDWCACVRSITGKYKCNTCRYIRKWWQKIVPTHTAVHLRTDPQKQIPIFVRMLWYLHHLSGECAVTPTQSTIQFDQTDFNAVQIESDP